MVWPEKTSGTLKRRDEIFAAGEFYILITGVGLNIGDLQWFFAADDDSEQTFPTPSRGFLM